jgi:hypothetical protein
LIYILCRSAGSIIGGLLPALNNNNNYMKYKKDKDLSEFLEETYKWFAKVFKEEVRFDDDGNLYTVPIVDENQDQ